MIIKDEKGRIVGDRCSYCGFDETRETRIVVHRMDVCRETLFKMVKKLRNEVESLQVIIGTLHDIIGTEEPKKTKKAK